MSERRRCELCGRVDHDVKSRLVEWTDDVVRKAGVKRWDTVDRCPDHQACRARIEATGKPWPIRDAHTRSTVKEQPRYEEVPV